MSLSAFFDDHVGIVHVRLSRVRGSSPREAGAEMFVAASGVWGTIGGGQLEYMAIDTARVMLRGGDRRRTMDVPLGPEIGQCCGGRVEVALARMTHADRDRACRNDASRAAARPCVYILGAGHVGRALALCFQPLPVACILVDNRHEELALCTAEVDKRLSALPEAEIRAAPAGSAFIVLTHDHALDFLLAAEALARPDAAYVGMIGSATKRARFERYCRETAPGLDARPLVCPIGASGSGDKRPEVIAAFAAPEVLARLLSWHREAAPAAP